jgi:hypothetical protein
VTAAAVPATLLFASATAARIVPVMSRETGWLTRLRRRCYTEQTMTLVAVDRASGKMRRS